MKKKNENDQKQSPSAKKNNLAGSISSITDDLRDMTVKSDEAAQEAGRRRQEIERALRNRRFWVPEQ